MQDQPEAWEVGNPLVSLVSVFVYVGLSYCTWSFVPPRTRCNAIMHSNNYMCVC